MSESFTDRIDRILSEWEEVATAYAMTDVPGDSDAGRQIVEEARRSDIETALREIASQVEYLLVSARLEPKEEAIRSFKDADLTAIEEE